MTKSSHITSLNRKDSGSNFSKKQVSKYDGTIIVSEKKLGSAKKIKIGLTSQMVKAGDQQSTNSQHYSASVNMPVRSFLTNSANKIPSLKNQMKSIIDYKQDDGANLEEQKQALASTKSAKPGTISGTYLKKFKSHHTTQTKVNNNVNAATLSQGSSQGALNSSGGQISFINQLNQRNNNGNIGGAKQQKASP